MHQKYLNFILVFIALAGMVTIIWWTRNDSTRLIVKSIDGMDNRAVKNDSLAETVNIGEIFNVFGDNYTPFAEKWSRFRGEQFDNISKSKVPLIDSFDGKVPEIIWSHELGEGHAGAAIYKGLVYLLDYDEDQKADLLRCFSLASGEELWHRGYHVNIKRNHGMSRTVPAVTEDFILTMGPRLQVMCMNRENGDLLWGMDVGKTYFAETPFWYTGQCPLIDEDKAIIGVGGEVLMVAVDCRSGEVLWEVPNDLGFKMSHSSVMPFTFNGIKMYVYSSVGGVCAVGAEGDNAGKLLWFNKAWNHSVVAPSPVCMPDGKIFLSSGYGAGSMLMELNEEKGVFSTRVLQEYPPKAGLACEQQTPIYADGHLYGILPKDAGANRNQLVCVDPNDCQEFKWTSGKENRYGLGPYLLADNKLFVLNDNATLTIANISPQGFKKLDEIQLFEGHDAWAPIALADGYMILRDSKKLICMDVRKQRQ